MVSAQTIRAVLLASATATSIFGLRATILASHGSVISPRRIAFWTTAMAPVIKSRLRSRWPIFDVLPSLGLPPVVCCRGTRPSQAEKSRPRRKLSIGGAKACSASAVIGPIPGIPTWATTGLQKVLLVLMVAVLVRTFDAALDGANRIYTELPRARERPIKGFLQVANVVAYLAGLILVVSIMIDRNPIIFLSGLGALTALILLLFETRFFLWSLEFRSPRTT